MDLFSIDNVINQYNEIRAKVVHAAKAQIVDKLPDCHSDSARRFMLSHLEATSFYVEDDLLVVELKYNEPYGGEATVEFTEAEMATLF